ncbi:hypothetical protein NDU88_004679 [Pleurodeles waltl]|uniref:Uncharacterized protein n=1 Tax=Pleurodeles waltl TaxID=8319 RepID=A0AAV7L0J9_PLEWA|nr:hypothetical protein NDU88_004679 [Pleurodeles waltl]
MSDLRHSDLSWGKRDQQRRKAFREVGVVVLLQGPRLWGRRRHGFRAAASSAKSHGIILQFFTARRGRATKEDGRLSPELRAAAVPRRRRGPRGGQKITLLHVKTLPQPRASDPNLNNRPPRSYRPAARLGGKRGKMAYREGRAASPRPENRLS